MNRGVQKRISTCRRIPRKTSHSREHWTRKKGQWKPKKVFGSLEEAESYIRRHKMKKYRAYVCPICGGVHIGYKDSEDDK